LDRLELTDRTLDPTISTAGAPTNCFDTAVVALATSATALYAGGFFFNYRNVTDAAHRIAKLDLADGTLDTTFSPQGSPTSNGFDDVVYALAVSGGSVYAGGPFVNYRGVTGAARKIAKLAATSGALDTT